MKEVIYIVTYCPKSNAVTVIDVTLHYNYLLCGDLHRRQVSLLFLSFFDYKLSFITGLNMVCLSPVLTVTYSSHCGCTMFKSSGLEMLDIVLFPPKPVRLFLFTVP